MNRSTAPSRTPLYAYLLGLAVIQSAVALAAMRHRARLSAARPTVMSPLRLVGAGIAGIGLAVLMQQIVPAPPDQRAHDASARNPVRSSVT